MSRQGVVEVGEQEKRTDTNDGFDLTKKLAEHEEYFDGENSQAPDENSYAFFDGFLYKQKRSANGEVYFNKLINVDPRIIEDRTEDNGLEIVRIYVIEGKTGNRKLPRLNVPVSNFNSLGWLCQWGNHAILEPGQAVKDQVRHATQTRSKKIAHTVSYTYTGWREVNGKWVYLNAGGAIGSENITVSLPRELQRYRLPSVPDNETEAIKASLALLEIGKRDITLPLLALTYLAPLTSLLEPMPNFSGYLYGTTGTFKTTLAVLYLNHFGSFQAAQLSSFDDTARSLEVRAFKLKDTLLVLDDYHPSTRRRDSEQKESTAQSLIRAYSNRTGRGRLNADTSEKGRYEPRGILLVTGEELVSLQSTLARVAVIELCEGDIDREKLRDAQDRADLLPHAMSSFLLWVWENMSDIKNRFKKQFSTLRLKASTEGAHRKLPEQVAFLQFALNAVLSWALDKNVLTEQEADKLSQEGWETFTRIAKAQADRIEREDPIKRFKEIVDALIFQNEIKIEHKDNSSEPDLGREPGKLVGYYDELFYYFHLEALWHSIQRYCTHDNSFFPVQKKTLLMMLRKVGLIETRGAENTVVVTIKGKSNRCLKVKKWTPSGEPIEPNPER